MFDASSRDGAPLDINLSFWQCVKAGIGFSIGAGIAGAVFMLLFYGALGAALSRGSLLSLLH